MYIWKSNQQRCNPHARYVAPDGTKHQRVPADLYEEILDPVRGDENLFYNQEIDEAPYLVVTPKPAEMVEAARIAKIDAEIRAIEQEAVDSGLIRTIIDDFMIRARAIADKHAPPVSEAELLDPQSEYYSRTYEKFHANEARRAAKRAER